jgi:meso-butanediol dehydrogenase / (S,S)-butanediol dehydrogenase / diacetyl reductase
MRLEGKVALVTGGGTGIGAAIARRFAAEGAGVVVMGRRAEPIAQVAGAIGGVALVGNAADAGDARRAVATAVERLGGLDVLVANAAGEGGGALLDADEETWRAGLEASLSTCVVIVREALPALIERGGGSIVVVASIAGLVAGPEMAAYTTAKAALLGLTRSLAVDYGPRGVRVNALCPGWVRTPMAEDEIDDLGASRGISREEAFGLATSQIPLRRPAEPEEIAAACLFLASSEASFVTGSVLVADGGSTAVDVSTLAFARA